jgi:hypothetical protein
MAESMYKEEVKEALTIPGDIFKMQYSIDGSER